MKEIAIEVTKADINTARERVSKGGNIALICPIALAASRVLGRQVSMGYSKLYEADQSTEIGFLPNAVSFVSNFDYGKTVKPTKFVLFIKGE